MDHVYLNAQGYSCCDEQSFLPEWQFALIIDRRVDFTIMNVIRDQGGCVLTKKTWCYLTGLKSVRKLECEDWSGKKYILDLWIKVSSRERANKELKNVFGSCICCRIS